MSVNLLIKNIDVRRLRERAARHRRSLQGELLAIIEEHALAAPKLTAADLLRRIRRRLATPREAVELIRAERDAR